MAWAFDQRDLPPNEKIVLLALADCENGQTHACMPGQEHIAAMSGMSVRTVRRMLDALEAKGKIRREHRYNERGYRTSDNYSLALRDNLTGRGEPTGQFVQAYRPTVAGTEEPEEEPEDTPPTPSADEARSEFIDSVFEGIWANWPKQAAKGRALAAWVHYCHNADLDAQEMTDTALRINTLGAAHRKHTEYRYIPTLHTVISEHRWLGAVPGPQVTPPGGTGLHIPAGHRPVFKDGYVVGSEPIDDDDEDLSPREGRIR
jgi:DNA-binding Lrp family transcriptional regulator